LLRIQRNSVLHLMKRTKLAETAGKKRVEATLVKKIKLGPGSFGFDLIREPVVKLVSFFQRMRLFQILALSGFVSMISISIVSGYIFFSFLQLNLLKQEVKLSSEKIQTISLFNNSANYFQGSENIESNQAIERFFQNIISSPDIFRVNVYDDNYRIIWSNEAKIIGKIFRDNQELDLAYTGVSNFEIGDADEIVKEEHDLLPGDVDQFVESYITVWDEKHEYVLGVIELYKSPRALFEILEIIRIMVVLASLLGGVILYGLLYWMVRMVHQRQRMRKQS
jgi:hypothetical protein